MDQYQSYTRWAFELAGESASAASEDARTR